MINVASRRNCQILYKLSHWLPAERTWVRYSSGWVAERTDKTTKPNPAFLEWGAPAYDIGMLIMMLPTEITIDGQSYTLAVEKDHAYYIHWEYEPLLTLETHGETLADTLALLAIDLIKKGYIKNVLGTSVEAPLQLTPTEEVVLATLSADEEEEWCVGYQHMQNLTRLDRVTLKPIIKHLRDLGLVEYWRGLMDDEGKVAGSGFCRSAAGNKYVEDNEL